MQVDTTKGIPLADKTVQVVVTSPPYWGLRDYGIDGQLGLERTPDEYVAKLVAVFHEVRRVLKADGTVWLNLGDSYTSGGRSTRDPGQSKKHPAFVGESFGHGLRPDTPAGLKPKDLVGIPWRVAFALQADGWYLRSDIIYSKPNPMPESVKDRPTRSHEYVFLLSKEQRYYYDAEAIKEPAYDVGRTNGRDGRIEKPEARPPNSRPRTLKRLDYTNRGRNRRTVWAVPTEPFPEAHFATFPTKLIEPCILAGSRAGDIVLDPFVGSGTAVDVAYRLGRKGVGLELSGEYIQIAKRRTWQSTRQSLLA